MSYAKLKRILRSRRGLPVPGSETKSVLYFNYDIESTSATWSELLRWIYEIELTGCISVQFASMLIEDRSCPDCRKLSTDSILRNIRESEYYVEECKFRWTETKLKCASQALMYIDALLRNPALVRCHKHTSWGPTLPSGSFVGELEVDFHDVNFAVLFYQD